MKLSEVLKKHTVKELKEIAKASGMQGYSKMKKDEIISKLAVLLLEKETAEQIFLCADAKEMELFQDAMNREIVVSPEEYYKCVYFFVSGFYYLSDKNSIIVPDEVKDLYAQIFTEEFIKIKTRFDLIMDYSVAGVNLYGVVPIDKVVEIFNAHNDEKTTVEEIVDTYDRAGLREVFCYISEDKYLVHEAIEGIEERDRLLAEQGEKPFYQPSKEEFLNYADDDYFERNEEFVNLKDYIQKNITDKEDIEGLCEDIQLACCFGEGPADALNEFLIRDIEFTSEQQVYEVGRLISQLNNATRMWCNRGFTPDELEEMGIQKKEPTEAPIIQPMKPVTYVRQGKKVNRNDPCPCGSGRKYKFCCGK